MNDIDYCGIIVKLITIFCIIKIIIYLFKLVDKDIHEKIEKLHESKEQDNK